MIVQAIIICILEVIPLLNYNEIAVIDDGINVEFYNNIPTLNNSVEIDINCNVKEYVNNAIEYSHGTVCAAIISKYTKDARISSVKIINESNKTTGKQFIRAIEWCLENHIGIVNLSLGSTNINEKKDICKIINKAVKNGMIIIAASSNDGKITYPAAFSNVIGVKTLEENNKCEGYIYNCSPSGGIDILAPSIHKLINYFEEEESQRCNSFAVPYITAQVHNIIKNCYEKCSILNVKYALLEKSSNYEDIAEKNIVNVDLEWINEAVVFNIISNENSNIESIEYIFPKIDEKVIFEEDRNIILKSIEEYMRVNGLIGFDTIIIKDFNRKEFRVNFFAENLSKYDKGLVYINDLFENKETLNVVYRNNIWFRNIDQCLDFKVQENINIDKPVILVVGEINQGIEMVLKLGEVFKVEGYSYRLYSDIARAQLYGIDFLPLKPLYYENRLQYEKIRELINLSEVDLSIVFIGIDKVDIDYINLVEKTLENDIRIVISHELAEYFTNDEEKYNIILTSVDDFNEKSNLDKKYYRVENIHDAYKVIIEIYN